MTADPTPMIGRRWAFFHTRNPLRPGDIGLIGMIVGDFIGTMGSGLIYFTALWWVLEEGTAAFTVGIVSLCITVSLSLGSLMSGALVAKFGARRVLLLSKTIASASACVMTALFHLDALTIPLLILMIIIAYFAWGPSMSADLSRVPALCRLSKRRLVSFYSANTMVALTGIIAGLGLAGFVVDWVGSAATVGLAGVFMLASLTITALTFPRDRAAIMAKSRAYSPMGHLRAVVAHPTVQKLGWITISAVTLILGISTALQTVLMPLMARAFEGSTIDLSIGMCAAFMGSAVGAVMARSLHTHYTIETVITIGGMFTGVVLIVAILIGGWWPFVAAIVSIATVGTCVATLCATHLQERMPASMQAQTMGTVQSLNLSTGAIAKLAAAALASLSLITAILVLAAASLVVALLVATLPVAAPRDIVHRKRP